MQLSLYISDLLFDHDCVTVPGFGSFLGNYKSAEYLIDNLDKVKLHIINKELKGSTII